jgi:hypothetical protein
MTGNADRKPTQRRHPRLPRHRRPRVDMLLKEAEKGGKTVTSITLPDGTKLTFGEDEQASSNPWLKELTKQ